MIELTKSIALELAPKVRVCAVAPGYVLTPMQRAEYTDAMAADAAVAAAEKILSETARGKVGDDLIAQGIRDLKAKLN